MDMQVHTMSPLLWFCRECHNLGIRNGRGMPTEPSYFNFAVLCGLVKDLFLPTDFVADQDGNVPDAIRDRTIRADSMHTGRVLDIKEIVTLPTSNPDHCDLIAEIAYRLARQDGMTQPFSRRLFRESHKMPEPLVADMLSQRVHARVIYEGDIVFRLGETVSVSEFGATVQEYDGPTVLPAKSALGLREAARCLAAHAGIILSCTPGPLWQSELPDPEVAKLWQRFDKRCEDPAFEGFMATANSICQGSQAPGDWWIQKAPQTREQFQHEMAHMWDNVVPKLGASDSGQHVLETVNMHWEEKLKDIESTFAYLLEPDDHDNTTHIKRANQRCKLPAHYLSYEDEPDEVELYFEGDAVKLAYQGPDVADWVRPKPGEQLVTVYKSKHKPG